MQILAVSLQRTEQEGMKFSYKFLEVEKETPTCYKLSKAHALLNNRTQVRKNEVDQAFFYNDNGRPNCRSCDIRLHFMAWILIEGNEPNYDLLRYWRKTLKNKAMEDLRARNEKIKEMYQQIINL